MKYMSIVSIKEEFFFGGYNSLKKSLMVFGGFGRGFVVVVYIGGLVIY